MAVIQQQRSQRRQGPMPRPPKGTRTRPWRGRRQGRTKQRLTQDTEREIRCKHFLMMMAGSWNILGATRTLPRDVDEIDLEA